jgi:hypothetical protein
VISSMSACAGTPAYSSDVRTWSTKPDWRNCRTETFTLTYGWRVRGSMRRHWATVCRAWLSTQRPIGTIRPLSSATSMNWSGAITPRTGCCQRTSASKPTASSVCRSTIGWYCSRKLPSLTAWSSAERSSRRSTIEPCRWVS